MSGQWPPDWGDDPDDVGAEAEKADADATDTRASEVTAYLAALPDPVLPDAVAARISAAIAAEATTRAEATARAGSAATGGRPLGPPPQHARIRRSRRFRVRAISSVAACLVLVALGFLLRRATVSSSSPSAPSSLAHGIAAPAMSSAGGTAGASRNGENLTEPVPAAAAKPSPTASAPFRVTVRGDAYQKSTLVSQVRERLASGTRAFTSSGAVGSVPTAALVGCVLRVTDNTVPSLVDEATYAGRPVYVIAVSSRAWVVGRGCTATHPELITSVSLGG